MPFRIQHVSVPRPLDSGDETRAFYSDLLGLQEKPAPRSIEHLDLIWYQLGGLELHLFVEGPVDDPSGRHFCLEIDDRADLIAVKDKLISAGYSPWDPDPIPGRPRFFCRDPFGNIIEFTTVEGNYLELESYKE